MTSISKRALVFGDSIASLVYTDDGSVPDASRLWVSQLQGTSGVHLQNLSAPGNSLSGVAGSTFSIKENWVAFNLMRGVVLPEFVIITAGTNDYAGDDVIVYTGPKNFHTDYRSILNYWKSNNVKTMVIPPLWRSDEATAYPHPDGAWPLATWRSWISSFATEYGATFVPHTDFGLTPDDFVQDTPTLKLHVKASGHDKIASTLHTKLDQLGWI